MLLCACSQLANIVVLKHTVPYLYSYVTDNLDLALQDKRQRLLRARRLLDEDGVLSHGRNAGKIRRVQQKLQAALDESAERTITATPPDHHAAVPGQLSTKTTHIPNPQRAPVCPQLETFEHDCRPLTQLKGLLNAEVAKRMHAGRFSPADIRCGCVCTLTHTSFG